VKAAWHPRTIAYRDDLRLTNYILERREVKKMTIEAMRYLNEVQVADMTARALSTLRNERARNEGIPYIKIGRSVRYNLQDVVQFMESHKIAITIEQS
jgi:hypothetical protein